VGHCRDSSLRPSGYRRRLFMVELKGRVAYGRPLVTRPHRGFRGRCPRYFSPRCIKILSTALGVKYPARENAYFVPSPFARGALLLSPISGSTDARVHARGTKRERRRFAGESFMDLLSRLDEIWRKFNNGHPVCRITAGRGLKKQTREPHTSILIIIISDPRDSPSPMADASEIGLRRR